MLDPVLMEKMMRAQDFFPLFLKFDFPASPKCRLQPLQQFNSIPPEKQANPKTGDVTIIAREGAGSGYELTKILQLELAVIFHFASNSPQSKKQPLEPCHWPQPQL